VDFDASSVSRFFKSHSGVEGSSFVPGSTFDDYFVSDFSREFRGVVECSEESPD